MELNSLTSHVDKFILDHGGYWDIPWLLAAITEELGELSHVLQMFAKIRDSGTLKKGKSVKMLIEEECGDLFFALICLSNFLSIDLETALFKTINKYNSRSEF